MLQGVKPLEMRIKLAAAMVALALGGLGLTWQGNRERKALQAAPLSVVIEGRTMTLNAHVWRDFMPGRNTPDGSPLMVSADLSAADGRPTPKTLRPTRLWVLCGDKVWSVRPSIEQLPPPHDVALHMMTRTGPKWGPGPEVDVVVSITDGRHEWRLRVPRIKIERTS